MERPCRHALRRRSVVQRAHRGRVLLVFFNDTATTEIYTLSLHDALPICSYLLLTSGFFVCGFQVAFITAHFPAYLRDIGIDARYAVIAMALIGFFNVIGSLSAGVIGQRYSKPYFLAYIYIA